MTSALILSPLLLALLVVTTRAATNFCAISSCQPSMQMHTMCRFPTSGAASACGKVVGRNVTAAERRTILRLHNDIRRDVKNGVYAQYNLPAASVLPNLRWANRLAKIAQRWADQCVGGDDVCRDLPRYEVGQHTADFLKTPIFDKDWDGDTIGPRFRRHLNNFKRTNNNNLTYIGNAGTSGLTQIIWGATTKIGCGYIAVEVIQDTTTMTKHFYVCNYAPAGNVLGQLIYQAASG